MSSDLSAKQINTAADAAEPVAIAHEDKGKGKPVVADEPMDEDEEDEEDDEEEEEDDDDDMAEDDVAEIDPSAIRPRRTRNIPRVDYASAAALEKAGLKPEDLDDEEQEDSFAAPDAQDA